MITSNKDIFAFIKPSLDAHTLGVNTAADLLLDCGYKVILGDIKIEKAMNDFKYEINKKIIFDWIINNEINKLGISYRLDEEEGIKLVGSLVYELKQKNFFYYQGGPIKNIYFAGLPKTCKHIEKEHKGLVITFMGGESIQETLKKLEIPTDRIPKDISEGSKYDEMRLEFGKDLINSQEYHKYIPEDRSGYPEYGTSKDTLLKRLDYNISDSFSPLMRAHVGPYYSSKERIHSVKEFIEWSKYLSKTRFLDILSIGTSQLTQSNFEEDWEDKINGGGVPVNSQAEYEMIMEAARPMLVRTYAGTKNIPYLAEVHEKTLNIAWHALSFWWFNRMDGRGPYDVYTNLKQHVETLKIIAKTNKPFEPNVPHHFAFRGADDVTYVVSAYLSAKLAKKMGIKTLILQNMLNTPRYTWGIQDLAKSRAMLSLVKELEDYNFRVILQPRAGLDYFSPNLEEAKIQLAAVSALMDDIDPHKESSPPVIHVVSYSEADHIATPDVVNESIKITQSSIKKYRELRRDFKIEDMSNNKDVYERMLEILTSARMIISAIEHNIKDPYSPEGFYKIFASGYLSTPYLWGDSEEFKHAKVWRTRPIKGSIKVIDKNSNIVSAEKIIEYANSNILEVEYFLKYKNN